MKKLNELISGSYDIDIYGIAEDSRNVKNGFLFVATKGYYVDHYDYIRDAIDNGAVCCVADRNIDVSVPVIIVDNINDYYIELCKKFYNVDPSEFRFIGITGTDGKTTTTTIIYQLLSKIKNIACIGTNGLLINGKIFPTNNTTPCVSELFETLSLIKKNNCKNVVMEVSSEALLHNRLKSFQYDAVGFTNITEDHLNIHKNIENYRNCKFKLLNLVKTDGLVFINGDDKNCQLIDVSNLYTVGLDSVNQFVISDVKCFSDCVNFCLSYKEQNYTICSPLLGLYNVYNVSMAFAICLLMGMDSNSLIDGILNLKPISGRREYLDFGQNYDIILDYAHTYNGIKCIFESVSNYEKIITVTGAAGGREKEKRSRIGNLVLEKSDLAIFTMDDPRYESVDKIIDQMVEGSNVDYIRIIDRKEAIFKALDLADEGCLVLILGKGRDNYMAIEDRKESYCDFDVVSEYFNK